MSRRSLQKASRAIRNRNQRRLQPELLESRLVLATVTVNTLNDSGPGSLRQAILDTNTMPGPDLIDFDTQLNGTISLTSGQLTPADDLTINGPGSAILSVDAGGLSRVFSIDDGQVTYADVEIKGLTITGGEELYGGGILSYENLTLDDVVISNNRANADGGGIRQGNFGYLSGSLTIRDSRIIGNTAGDDASAIDFGDSADLMITNTEISGNQSGDAPASGTVGAVRVLDTFVSPTGDSDVVFDGVMLTNNSIVTGPGATSALGNGALFSDTNNSMNVEIRNSVISNNSTSLGTGFGETGSGGGLFADVSSLTLTDSTVSGNNNRGGGGIYMPSSGSMTLVRSTIHGNSAGYVGGGIKGFGDVTLIESTVSSNTAYLYGGGISGNDLTVIESTIHGNSAGYGGGIHVRGGGSLTLTQTTVSGNSAGSGGGGGGIRLRQQGSATLTQSTISGNSASSGGGIRAEGSLALTQSTVSGNSASNSGGGISLDQLGSGMLTQSTVSGNSAGGNGGGILGGTSGSVMLTQTTVSGNIAAGGGGGILGDATLTQSTVSGNSASGGGGGIQGDATLTQSTVSGNSAGSSGGGIFGDVTLTHSTVSGNSAGQDGGGISFRFATINGSIVAGNSAGYVGPDLELRGPSGAIDELEYSLIGNNSGSGLTEAPLGTPDANGNYIGGPTYDVINPMLGPLADNGGPTLTHALLTGSPAIDAGDPAAMAGVGDTPEFDQRGMPFARVSAGRMDMGAVELIDGDFNDDGFYTYIDVDELVGAIAPGTNDTTYDLNSDGLVDLTDRDIWLAVAGAANLDSHDPFLLGDANLDGVVDGQDFIVWNAHKFSPTGLWSRADWNADGLTDGQDFIIWNANKFQTSGSPLLSVLHQPPDLRESKIEPPLPLSVAVPQPIASAAIRRIDDAFADLHRREERGEPRGDADMFGGVISEFTMKPYFF